MMSRVLVTQSGDSDYLPGDLVNRLELLQGNEVILAEGKTPAQYREMLLGITKASLSTDSFLSAASFQHTIKVLTRAAASGAVDPLFGLKENVIIGKLIPAGTGFAHGPFAPKPEIYETLPLATAEEGEQAMLDDGDIPLIDDSADVIPEVEAGE